MNAAEWDLVCMCMYDAWNWGCSYSCAVLYLSRVRISTRAILCFNLFSPPPSPLRNYESLDNNNDGMITFPVVTVELREHCI